ncbi:MAG: GNAT family N-acetyltransferase [Lysobacteraceae bacterium]|nr:MAG: GNAT family N-acetyltransferase [Xanthomonadaceae bacterium]
MPIIEQQLQERYPQWFRGQRARLSRPLLRTLGRWSRFDEIEIFLETHSGLRDFEFVDAALRYLQVRYEVDAHELNAIPARGRVLVVSNHPSGALDSLALLDPIGKVRRDVRIVANDMLSLFEPLGGLLLPVQVFGGRASPERLRAIERALEAEQCVIVFPAGEVSRLGVRGVRDSRWRRGFLHFARNTGAPVLPVRIVARNSALFYGASALYKPVATALLAREMFTRRRRPLHLYVGQPLRIDRDTADASVIRSVRQALYALGCRRPQAVQPEPLPVPIDHAALIMAISLTELLGRTGDGKEIRLARLAPGAMPMRDPLMLELGRLRELTFREVGEGTGRSYDLDRYDAHYEHILVWDAASARIAGAYRVKRGVEAISNGAEGLYTASLFRYNNAAMQRIVEGLELGRSFVVPEYWGGRSLDYLWQGIGAYLRRYPDIRYLFGAVSISAALPREARDQLVAYYSRYYGAAVGSDRHPLAVSMRPFRYFAAPPDFGALDVETAFEVLKANLEAVGATVPVLYRQYTELCEPGGARFLAFGIDPDFSDSIDGLIEVDLHQVRPKKRQRYLCSRETSV